MIEKTTIILFGITYLWGMLAIFLDLRSIKKDITKLLQLVGEIDEKKLNVIPIPSKPRAGGIIKHKPFVPKEVIDPKKPFIP